MFDSYDIIFQCLICNFHEARLILAELNEQIDVFGESTEVVVAVSMFEFIVNVLAQLLLGLPLLIDDLV